MSDKTEPVEVVVNPVLCDKETTAQLLGRISEFKLDELLRAGRITAKRLAGIPEWDGVMRFNYRDEKKHMQLWEGDAPAVQLEAQIALYAAARGSFDGCVSEISTAMKNDPEDPPVVRFDILRQGDPLGRALSTAKPWGYRP